MSAEPKHNWTVEEYIAFENQSDERHEYYRGDIILMVGGSPNHSRISNNTGTALTNILRPTPCVVYNSDQRIRVPATRLFTYADVTVACDKPEFDEDDPYALLNPTVIVEVLSPSTERYDRGTKFLHYQTIPSLQYYILISQHKHVIEYFERQPDSWKYFSAIGIDASIHLNALNCTLTLADVYEKVTLEDEESPNA